MTELEREIVELIDEGWVRWKIAEKIGMSESTVRSVIKRLCEENQCSMRDLPKLLKEDQ